MKPIIIPERNNVNDVMMLAEDPLYSETFNSKKIALYQTILN